MTGSTPIARPVFSAPALAPSSSIRLLTRLFLCATVRTVTLPRIAAGLALAALMSGIVVAPAMAADVPPVVSPDCNATVRTPTVFDQETLADTVPMTVQAPFECGSAFETNAWSITWRSEAGDAIVWKPGGYSQVRNTTFTVPVPNLYPGAWTLTSNVPWIKVTSASLAVLGTVHNTATVSRSGSRFTVAGTIDRLAKGGRVPWANAPGLLLSQLTRGEGYPYRARDLPVSASGRYSYTGVSNDMLVLQLSTGRILQSPYVEFATSEKLTLAAYSASAPPVTVPPVTGPPIAPPVTAPPVTAPAPPVATNPAPPASGPTPPSQPAPPAVRSKHHTVLSIASAKRTGSRLTVKATLIDQDRARTLAGVVKLQRWTTHGWRTVTTVPTGRFTVRTPKATYRLVFAGTATYAAATSRIFLR